MTKFISLDKVFLVGYRRKQDIDRDGSYWVSSSLTDRYTEAVYSINDEPIPPRLDHSKPDDLRKMGWAIAIHNDYFEDGIPYTFWLLTKKDTVSPYHTRAIRGEGRNDTIALDHIREQIAKSLA